MAGDNSATILVVDDREDNRYITSRILRGAGFTPVEASTGREALAQVEELPDLVVLDIRLPDITGYEVCRRIKANPATRGIPVLHLSASFVSSESKVMSLEGGADAYLTQPAEPPVLLATVKALLRLKKAEASSRLSARQWQVTFDSLSEGICLLDSDGRISRCNLAMAEMTRWRYSQIEGQYAPQMLKESLHIGLALPIASSLHFEIEVESETHQWFRVSMDPVLDSDGASAGSVLLLVDITGRKRTEEALKRNEQLAATGRLAHGIAHEINNPLEALINLIYLMEQPCSESELKDYVSKAAKELSRVSRITKQTLAFHRESSEPVKIIVSDLLDSVLTLHGPQLSSRDLSIRRQYGENAVIYGFPAALQQVISNLVTNAIDASAKGGEITVRTSPSRQWSRLDRKGVRISIADRGTGIPAALRQRVFEAFFTTKSLKGSGLGLWLSSDIIQKHGGYIRLRSSVIPSRSFTCFSIFIPAPTREQPNELPTL